MDSSWRKEPKEDSRRSRKDDFGDKILWERPEETESNRNNRSNRNSMEKENYDYGWTGRLPKSNRASKWNFDYSSGPSWGSGDGFKSIITNKFLIQTLVSILIFMVAIGIYDRQDPGSKVASRAVKYLLSVDVNIEPIMGRIVKLVFPEITEGTITPDGGVINTTGGNGTGNGSTGGSNSQNGINQNPPTQPAYLGNDQIVSTPLQPSASLKMALPITGRIIKPYGWVIDELDGYKRYHEGIDVEAKLGTKIHAVLDGKVIKVGEDKVLGKYVQISHSGQLTTLYAQLEKTLVQENEQVKEGDIIGQVGQSGAAGEPHLHFEVREKGELVDPFNKLNQSGIQ